jgi:predicted HicB family RNase H-like nuclease
MKKRGRGRPPKEADQLRSESLLVRLEIDEKKTFKSAADKAGVPLSTWVRERLRRIATRELGKASVAR